MLDIVNSLASDRLMRALFWRCADAGPILLAVLLVLLFVASWRRTALLALAAGAVCAVTMAIVFHFNYAITTWGGHESAIKSLDRAALSAGFAAGALAAIVLGAAHRAIAAIRRRG